MAKEKERAAQEALQAMKAKKTAESTKKDGRGNDKQPQQIGNLQPAAVSASFGDGIEILRHVKPAAAGDSAQDPVQGGSGDILIFTNFRRNSSFARWLGLGNGGSDDGRPKSFSRRLTFNRKEEK